MPEKQWQLHIGHYIRRNGRGTVLQYLYEEMHNWLCQDVIALDLEDYSSTAHPTSSIPNCLVTLDHRARLLG